MSTRQEALGSWSEEQRDVAIVRLTKGCRRVVLKWEKYKKKSEAGIALEVALREG